MDGRTDETDIFIFAFPKLASKEARDTRSSFGRPAESFCRQKGASIDDVRLWEGDRVAVKQTDRQ